MNNQRDPRPQSIREAKLVAKGRGDCNCGWAMSCKWGCSAAQLYARDETFEILLEALDARPDPTPDA